MKNNLAGGATFGNQQSVKGQQTFGDSAKLTAGVGVGLGVGGAMKGKCEVDKDEESITFGFGGKVQALVGVEVAGEIKVKNPINQDVRTKFQKGNIKDGTGQALINVFEPGKNIINTISDSLGAGTVIGKHIVCDICRIRCCYKCETPKGMMAFCSKFEGVFSKTCISCTHHIDDHRWEDY